MQGTELRHFMVWEHKNYIYFELNVTPLSEMQINTRVCNYLYVFIFVRYSTSF